MSDTIWLLRKGCITYGAVGRSSFLLRIGSDIVKIIPEVVLSGNGWMAINWRNESGSGVELR